MCGIAGWSAASGADVDPGLLTMLLLAGLAERGEDACGYGWRVAATGAVDLHKRDLPPHRFLAEEGVQLDQAAREGVVHVRDHTKGRPSSYGNNHPIRHGSVIGVHNGIIQNDDELFRIHGRTRSVHGASVDSEAIFMLLDLHDGDAAQAASELVGSYSCAWLDERESVGLYVARGRGRPLFLGHCRTGNLLVAASTRHALTFVAHRMQLDLQISVVPAATRLRLEHGAVVDRSPLPVQDFFEQATTRYAIERDTARAARELVDGHVDAWLRAR